MKARTGFGTRFAVGLALLALAALVMVVLWGGAL